MDNDQHHRHHRHHRHGHARYGSSSTASIDDGYQRPPREYYEGPDGQPVPVRRDSPMTNADGDPEKGHRHKKESPILGPIELPKEKRQHLVVRLLRGLFIVFQAIIMIAALALVIVGSIWYRNVRNHNMYDTFFATLPMMAIGIGVVIFLMACIGMVSAITRGKSGAIVYCVLIGILIGGEAYVLWRAGRLQSDIMGFLSRKWDAMRDDQRFMVQQWRKCCGFGEPGDRAVEPCPASVQTGCAQSVRDLLQQWAGGIVKTLVVAIVVECILIVLSLVISFAKKKYLA